MKIGQADRRREYLRMDERASIANAGDSLGRRSLTCAYAPQRGTPSGPCRRRLPAISPPGRRQTGAGAPPTVRSAGGGAGRTTRGAAPKPLRSSHWNTESTVMVSMRPLMRRSKG